MNVKKIAAYAVLLLVLAGTAFIVHEVRMTNAVIEHPELFIGGRESPTVRENARFVMPPPGKEERMTLAELSWMLKESIELDVIMRFSRQGDARDKYNARVSSYNERSATIVYVDSDMEAAKRRVAVSLDEIVQGALDDGLAAAVANQPGDRKIRAAQMCLRVLNFYPFGPNGRMDDQTAHAVRMFRMTVGLPVTEEIDDRLLAVLRKTLEKELRPETIGF